MLTASWDDIDIEQCCRELALNPGSAELHHRLGRTLAWRGQNEAALACFRKAVALREDCCEYHNNLGSTALDLGRVNEAIHAYRKALRLNPDSGWYHQNLAEAVARKGWQVVARGIYCQAVKVNADDVLRWQQAWRDHPQVRGNALIENPVFVVGSHHSGTTIMTRLLAAHPGIRNCQLGESCVGAQTPAMIRETLNAWDRDCAASPQTRWVEKSVQHSFMIGKLLAFRPQGRVVVMMRDGRDVVCSTKTRKRAYRYFGQRVEQWIYYNLAAMPFWDHPNVRLVRYEDLIADPEGTLEAVCAFLDEQYAPQMLEYALTPIQWNAKAQTDRPEQVDDRGDHIQLRNWQINQPLFDGRGRWRREMTDAEKRIFKNMAQEYIGRWGYADNDRW